MATVEREHSLSAGTGDFRHPLLDSMWKVALGAGILGTILLPAYLADWRWLATPLLWGAGALTVWRLLKRERTLAAAWVFVLVSSTSVMIPSILFPDRDTVGEAARVLLTALPFALTIQIFLANALLPPWSAFLVLAYQLIATLILPLMLYGEMQGTNWGALVASALAAAVAWLTLRPLYDTAMWSLANYMEMEQRAQELLSSRDEVRKSLLARDSLNQRLQQANAELARQTAQMETSSELSRLLTSTIELDEMLLRVAELLRDRFAVSAALFLGSLEEKTLTLHAISAGDESSHFLRSTSRSQYPAAPMLHMAPGAQLEIGERTAVGMCALRGEPRVLENVENEATVWDHLLTNTVSEMAIPLIARGQVVGVLDLQSPAAGVFDEGLQAVLVSVADQITGGITNLTSFGETRRALQELSRLQQRYVQDSWERFMPQLEAAGYRLSGSELEPLSHRPLPEVSQVLLAGETVIDPHQGVAAPISFRGQVIGALGLRDPDPNRQWTTQDINLVESVARQMSVIIDNARLVQETQQRLAEISELNRRYVRQAWDEYLPRQQRNEIVFAQPGVPLGAPLPAEIEQVLAESHKMAVIHDQVPDSALLTPISLREQIIGALGLQETGAIREWTDEDQEIMDAVAAQMSWAIENARLIEETERRARELEMTAIKLRETDQFRSQFLANMSHELRTPLNSIIGFSRVILKGIDGPLTDLQKTDLEAIFSNGQHLLTLINEILDMSKIEAGKMELVIEDVDLNALVRGVISASKALIKDKPIELESEIQENLPNIRADGTRIRQVITNLMSNAAKFTEEGQITFRVWTDEEMVYVSVQDTGEGIPEDKISLVFEAFRQVDGSSTRRAQGTGLGMPISREFIQMHGGRIWLESEYGVGSTFTFCIPIEGPVESVPELGELQIDKGKKVLLVIDRDEGELELYRQALGERDYQWVGLYDPAQAVRWTRFLRPHAILMDMQLENGSGYEALEALKSRRATREVPVVVCSTLDGGGQAISMGAVAYLTKPIVEKELAQVMSRLSR